MIGVLLPPIDAGSVGAGRSRSIGRPAPLKSIPAHGDRRSTGALAMVIFAGQVVSLPGWPYAGKLSRTERSVGWHVAVSARGATCEPSPRRIPTKNMRSRAWGTP